MARLDEAKSVFGGNTRLSRIYSPPASSSLPIIDLGASTSRLLCRRRLDFVCRGRPLRISRAGELPCGARRLPAVRLRNEMELAGRVLSGQHGACTFFQKSHAPPPGRLPLRIIHQLVRFPGCRAQPCVRAIHMKICALIFPAAPIYEMRINRNEQA